MNAHGTRAKKYEQASEHAQTRIHSHAHTEADHVLPSLARADDDHRRDEAPEYTVNEWVGCTSRGDDSASRGDDSR